MLVTLAFVADKFVTDAVITETLLNDALVASCKKLLTNNLLIDAVSIETFTKVELFEI